MNAMLTENLDVFYKGKKESTVPESRILVGFDAGPETGCGKAGRSSHKMFRISAYHTFCICEDCDWEF